MAIGGPSGQAPIQQPIHMRHSDAKSVSEAFKAMDERFSSLATQQGLKDLTDFIASARKMNMSNPDISKLINDDLKKRYEDLVNNVKTALLTDHTANGADNPHWKNWVDVFSSSRSLNPERFKEKQTTSSRQEAISAPTTSKLPSDKDKFEQYINFMADARMKMLLRQGRKNEELATALLKSPGMDRHGAWLLYEENEDSKGNRLKESFLKLSYVDERNNVQHKSVKDKQGQNIEDILRSYGLNKEKFIIQVEGDENANRFALPSRIFKQVNKQQEATPTPPAPARPLLATARPTPPPKPTSLRGTARPTLPPTSITNDKFKEYEAFVKENADFMADDVIEKRNTDRAKGAYGLLFTHGRPGAWLLRESRRPAKEGDPPTLTLSFIDPITNIIRHERLIDNNGRPIFPKISDILSNYKLDKKNHIFNIVPRAKAHLYG